MSTIPRGRFITREEVGLGSIEGSSLQMGSLKEFALQNRQDNSPQLGTLQDYLKRFGNLQEYLKRYGEEKNVQPLSQPPSGLEDVVGQFKACHESISSLFKEVMDLPLNGKIGAERRSDSYDAETIRFFHGCVERESRIFDGTTSGLVREILALSSPEPGQVEALSSILTFLYAGNESKGAEKPWDQKDADMMSLVSHTPIKLLRMGDIYFLSLNGRRVSRIRLTPQGAASEIVRINHIDGYEDADLEAVKNDILESIGAPWKVWL